MPVIFSNFLVSNEKSGYTENISTIIFLIHISLLSYQPVKVYRIDMDHPVNIGVAMVFAALSLAVLFLSV